MSIKNIINSSLLFVLIFFLGFNVYATNYRPVRSNVMVIRDPNDNTITWPSHRWSSSDFCDNCEDSVMRNIFSKTDFGDHGIYYKYIEAFDGSGGTGTFELGFCTESTVRFPNEYGGSVTNFYKSDDVQVVDKGIAYIIKNGFTIKFIKSSNSGNGTNDPYYKNRLNYWITQFAIWWYTDGGIPNIQARTTKPELYNQIKALYDGAVAEKNGTTNTMLPILFVEDSKMVLEGDYYVSKLIELKYAEEGYTISVDNANFEVVDANNNPKTQFGLNEKFKVRINKNNVNDLTGVKITATTNTKTRYGNQFTSSSIQNLAVIHYGTAQRKPTLNLEIEEGCPLTFKVVNSKTNTNVCSGTFKIVDINNQPVSDINGNPIGDIVLSSNNCNPSYQLPNGKYKIKQVVVAPGYYNNSGDVTVDMETSCADEVIIRNEPLCDIKIEIVDKLTNEKICSGSVIVKDSNGNIAKDKDGNEVGRVTLSDTKCGVTLNLPHGNYQVVEETAPTGYIINNETYNINAETTCPDKIIIKNEPLCAIEIDVVDKDTNEKVCQGTLIVKDKDGNIAKDKNGNEVGRVTLSTDNCHVSLDVLKGEYTVLQETASNPYIKDTTIYTVDTRTSCPVKLIIPNDKYYSIKILKKDRSNDENIKGAKLVLEDIEGNIIKEFTSTSEGVIVDHLLKGTYYLREIEAPKGYKLNEEKTEIEVGHDKDYEVSYYNEEILVPRTSANSFLMVISVIAGTFGISLLLLSKRKKVLVHE